VGCPARRALALGLAEVIATGSLIATGSANAEPPAAGSGSSRSVPEAGLAIAPAAEPVPGLTPPAANALDVTLAGAGARIDGISDQNLQAWGPYFSAFIRDSLVDGARAHVTLSRYVVQWNVMSGSYPAYLAKYEAWYRASSALGLTPEVAVTSYDGVLPSSASEYQQKIELLLD